MFFEKIDNVIERKWHVYDCAGATKYEFYLLPKSKMLIFGMYFRNNQRIRMKYEHNHFMKSRAQMKLIDVVGFK